MNSEVTLNGYRMRDKHQIDWKKQYELAIEAFIPNGFCVLIGDRQIDNLDEEIDLEEVSTATFVKLVPLVGG